MSVMYGELVGKLVNLCRDWESRCSQPLGDHNRVFIDATKHSVLISFTNAVTDSRIEVTIRETKPSEDDFLEVEVRRRQSGNAASTIDAIYRVCSVRAGLDALLARVYGKSNEALACCPMSPVPSGALNSTDFQLQGELAKVLVLTFQFFCDERR